MPRVAGRSPSRWWYLLALLLPAVGGGLAFWLGFGSLQRKVEAMPRLVVPGEDRFHLEAGEYTAYYEHRSVVKGVAYHGGEELARVLCRVQSDTDQVEVRLARSSARSRYSLGSHAGTSIFGFRVAKADDYLFACAYADGRQTPAVVIAVGGGLLGPILAIVLPVVGAALMGLAVFLIVRVRRRRALRP